MQYQYFILLLIERGNIMLTLTKADFILLLMFIIITALAVATSFITILRLRSYIFKLSLSESDDLRREYEKWLKFKFAGSEPKPEQITDTIDQARKNLLPPFLFGYVMIVVGGGTALISFLENKNILFIILLLLVMSAITIFNQQYYQYFMKRFKLFEKLSSKEID